MLDTLLQLQSNQKKTIVFKYHKLLEISLCWFDKCCTLLQKRFSFGCLITFNDLKVTVEMNGLKGLGDCILIEINYLKVTLELTKHKLSEILTQII